MKKIISTMLAVITFLSMISTAAFAETGYDKYVDNEITKDCDFSKVVDIGGFDWRNYESYMIYKNQKKLNSAKT